MDALTPTILSVLISLTPSYKDITDVPQEQCGVRCSKENPEERVSRMNVLASAISEASYRATCQNDWDTSECKCINEFDNDDCRKKQVLFLGTEIELAVSLISIGYLESAFALNVHENNCYPGECDEKVNKTLNGILINRYFRAKTNWQIQYGPFVSKDDWASMAGSDLDSTKRAAWVATKIWSFCWNKSKLPRNSFVCYAGSSRHDKMKWTKRAEFYDYRLAEFNKIHSE